MVIPESPAIEKGVPTVGPDSVKKMAWVVRMGRPWLWRGVLAVNWIGLDESAPPLLYWESMSPISPPHLKDYPVVLTLPILWGDQDAFGHVNNVVYFRWCESVRVAYLSQAELQALLVQANLGPILASIQCDYLRQLNFPDTVQIGARVTRLGNKSLSMEHAIFSEALQEIVAKADSVVVLFDYVKQQSCTIPPEIRTWIEGVEGKSLGTLSSSK